MDPPAETSNNAAAPPAGLASEMLNQGGWLFRHRGMAPVPVLILVAVVGIPTGARPWGAGAVEPWQALGLMLCVLGLGIRWYGIGKAAHNTSGGNTHSQVAERLNTTGLYSVVRHPLYLGNALMWAGVALFPGSTVAVLVAVPWFLVHYERVMLAEEAFLLRRFGSDFLRWADRTPALVPDPTLWVAAGVPTDWRRVVRRDYSAVLGFVVVAFGFESLTAGLAGFGWQPTGPWMAFLLAGVSYYVAVRVLRRATNVFDPATPAIATEATRERPREVETSQLSGTGPTMAPTRRSP